MYCRMNDAEYHQMAAINLRVLQNNQRNMCVCYDLMLLVFYYLWVSVSFYASATPKTLPGVKWLMIQERCISSHSCGLQVALLVASPFPAAALIYQ